MIEYLVPDMKKTKDACDVQSCFLCKGCLPEWLPAVELAKNNMQFKKGETIFKEGKPVTGIYFLYKGRVKVHKQWGREKELIIRFAMEGDIIGHRGIGAGSAYPVSATALEAVTICFVDTAFFQSTLKINPGLTYQLMMLYARELHETEQRMHDLVHLDMKGRIADSLLLLQKQFGMDEEGNINMSLTRQDLASFAGTTYETIFRTMNDLVNDKVIRLKEKNIKINNEAALRAYTMAG